MKIFKQIFLLCSSLMNYLFKVILYIFFRLEKIYEDSLTPSPSVKIQIIDGKVYLR